LKVPDIENMNISKDFPLIKGDYVFVLYGDQMCVRRVVAVYFEAYGHHCYTEEVITDLDDISYISLHIYVPIHHLFSDLTREECNLLTHHLASNIVYHIGPTNVLIEENILKLQGNEKKYYFDYFGRKDIIEKIS
jgi:hypothetical protein